MCLINPMSLNIDCFKCKNHRLAKMLMVDFKISLFGISDGYFYFIKDEILEKALKEIPIYYKIFKNLP